MTNNLLETQYHIARAFMRPAASIDETLHQILQMSAAALGVERAVLVTLDQDGSIAQAFSMPEQERLWEFLTAHNLINYVMYTRRVLSVSDLAADERWTSDKWTGSVYAIPVACLENLWGVYLFLAAHPHHFADDRMRFAHEVAAMTADALEQWISFEDARVSEARTRHLYERAQQEQVEHVRAEQMRRDLTAMIFHDLRGPLQNVTSSLSGLSRVLTGYEQPVVDELLHVGTQSVRRMTRMVKSLLDLERLEAGRPIMGRQPTKLHNLLSDALELVYPAAREAGQTLALELDDALPTVAVDTDMILRVLTNLIENAIKHTPMQGHITVRARAHADTVRVSVTDTGPGVPPHFHQEIFDKYFRIKYANAPNGVGLGLAFCRLAVEAHGGAIWVENEPGGGAVFAFTLPTVPINAPAV